jgi:dsDNA-specific endonuclease/ATPase MutS2
VDAEDPIQIPITDTLDLIHGRGIGVQRERIRSLLGSLDFVLDFHDADPTGGGWGSTVVLLAPNSLEG